MISMLMLGALSLVREREMGTREPLLTNPLASWEQRPPRSGVYRYRLS
jgi:hypothetical protein